MMKKYFFRTVGFVVLAIGAAVLFQRFQATIKTADDAKPAPVAAAPLSASFENAVAEQMPPARNGGRYPAVNRQRLQTLAGSDYEGPTYTADYSRYEMIAAQKKGYGDRSPASEKKTKKSSKTK